MPILWAWVGRAVLSSHEKNDSAWLRAPNTARYLFAVVDAGLSGADLGWETRERAAPAALRTFEAPAVPPSLHLTGDLGCAQRWQVYRAVLDDRAVRAGLEEFRGGGRPLRLMRAPMTGLALLDRPSRISRRPEQPPRTVGHPMRGSEPPAPRGGRVDYRGQHAERSGSFVADRHQA
ncbi:hypothetical protein GCM10027080_24780 [Pedococcus soli]